MKKPWLFSLLIFSFFLLCPSVFAQNEDILKIESSIDPRRLSRSEEGKVVIKLKVKDGMNISPYPSFIIEFLPNEQLVFPKNFFTASDLGIDILEEGGEEYLDLESPIEIPFTVSLEAKRGSHTLEGRIKYFACSRKEGWGLKSSARFSVSFFTRPTVIRK